MEPAGPTLRVAALADEDAIGALMKESIRSIFPHFYDRSQTESAIRYIGDVDRTLVADGTYFVLESEGEVVGCGGWSRRNLLYSGSGHSDSDARLLDPHTEPARVRAMFVRSDWTRRGLGRRILEECETAAREEEFVELALMATLPGVPLYAAYGFRPLEEVEITMPDGITLACVSMDKPVEA